jgi:hypothetical protein
VSALKRLSGTASSSAARGRWLARGAWLLAAAEVLVTVRDHLAGRLTANDRRRLVEIVRTSRGRPSNVSERERRELRALIGKVEPGELAKRVASSGLAGRLRRR